MKEETRKWVSLIHLAVPPLINVVYPTATIFDEELLRNIYVWYHEFTFHLYIFIGHHSRLSWSGENNPQGWRFVSISRKPEVAGQTSRLNVNPCDTVSTYLYPSAPAK